MSCRRTKPSLGSRTAGTSLLSKPLLSLNSRGLSCGVVTTPYFIGTKLEAFGGRGRGDFYASSDLEDIMTVLDGRSSVVDEVEASRRELRRYIGKEIGRLLDNP
jgi:hypothetical protein